MRRGSRPRGPGADPIRHGSRGRRPKPGDKPWHLRPLRPGDEGKLIAFLQSHTPETIYQRYGYYSSGMSHERAASLVGVDQSRDCALGIFEAAAAGEILHAVGRYCLEPDGTAAEVAFVVRESLRHLGMATTLLEEMIRTAKARNLHLLWAVASATNTEMISVLRSHHFNFGPPDAAGVVWGALILDGPRGQRR